MTHAEPVGQSCAYGILFFPKTESATSYKKKPAAYYNAKQNHSVRAAKARLNMLRSSNAWKLL
jgi:hypothetical protein